MFTLKLFYAYKFFVIFIIFFGISACVSSSRLDESRYYSLTPLSQIYSDERLNPQLNLGIGPVEISSILNRPQLVYRENNNEIKISEHNQWAGSLREEIQKTLIERAMDISGSDRIMHYPWPRDHWPDYETHIRIDRLDGTLGKEVVLVAHWDLFTERGKKLLSSRTSRHTITLTNNDFLTYVIAQQTALSHLADEIVNEVVSLQNN
ncbi:MAG: membrane integrity-associated transporter subunit PqiC [Gammaproteobacteria bacterium]